MFAINGKTAVITGDTSGIGLATAEAFLKKGAKVVIAGRNAQRGADAEARLKRVAPGIVFRQTDTSDEDDVKALINFASRPLARSISCSTTPVSAAWRPSTR